MRKQSSDDRLKRLKEGCCPVHGLVMGQAGLSDDRSTFIMECPRRDCNIQTFEEDAEDGSIVSIKLLPEFEYLLGKKELEELGESKEPIKDKRKLIVKLKNFREIKIDEARATEIVKWYVETGYDVSINAGCSGCTLDPILLIKLLSLFGNSKDLERDFRCLVGELFKEEEGR
jgi:hypothetical protein